MPFELPPMLEPIRFRDARVTGELFTADQMAAYALLAVKQEREQSEQDAKRYRWLREQTDLVASKLGTGIAITNGPKYPKDWRLLDEMIDAAIRQSS